ncbi:hypothetical protein A1Q2_03622 [Trichosporon asahii var. asahii CBS 8904]|uniref:DNA-directed RNA polymerase III subunit RPC4 n=2 Tax=Trichosporon asahii var. asahii TaxID=189963 RepID=K1VDL3_TRIAC|nr:hypothetical protein A1Q1_05234 [Trichosporon asahii var. asahii CBS 2479]EJT53271.1 hypothetical protein A1Q1_05234 [Trichosporon asahii var. asahii CBS 2479]EKD02070.1 hypothetical protein A1Q2_03622 [Trichosporon asahii var. asahii CBS 8904]
MPGQRLRPTKPTRPRASLVAAAAASESPSTSAPAAGQQPLFLDPDADDEADEKHDAMEDTKEDTREPAPAATPAPALTQAQAPTQPTASASSSQVQGARTEPVKMKFKPKMPIRRAVQEDVKTDVATSSRGRGGIRGRGRGGMRGGRGGSAAVSTIAAGPFGGNRPTSRRVVAPPPPSRGMETVAVEVYSDNEDGSRPGVIDIDAVSGLSESAPTSVYRARDLDGGKAAAKAKEKEKIKAQKERKRRQKLVRAAVAGDVPGDVFVKAEPVSPSRPGAPLPTTADDDMNMEREGDSMIPADQTQDRDEAGRRVRALTSVTDISTVSGTPDVNEAQRVDLSESEDEEFEEDLGGDFILVPGGEHPEDKLFTFQFPHMFPKFKPPPEPVVDVDGAAEGAAGAGGAAAGATGAGAEAEKKEEKPKLAAAAAGRKKPTPPPTGRIGSLVVLKSGKVKMVMGSGDSAVVMDVSPGVSPSFLQTLVHVDQKSKTLAVAGEVHKSYVVTPDVDRLLDELFINGGETPGDREKRALRQVKMERGVKMELD